MTRLAIYTASAVMALTAMGCGGGGAPPPPATPAAATPAAPVDDDPPGPKDKKLSLIMSMNDNHQGVTVTAACLGSPTGYVPLLKRGQRMHWFIKNDEENPCPGLDEDKVELRFDKPIWVDPLDPNPAHPDPTKRIANLKPKAGKKKIVGRVFFEDPIVAMPAIPKDRYKYTVYYDSQKASPDPDVDVDGDCGGGCGPGGGP